jgi:hypothetical protein
VSGPNAAALAQRPPSRLQDELQRALGIGEAELVANRAGQITRRQALRLAFHDAGTWLVFAVMAITAIGSVFFVFAVPIVALFPRWRRSSLTCSKAWRAGATLPPDDQGGLACGSRWSEQGPPALWRQVA